MLSTWKVSLPGMFPFEEVYHWNDGFHWTLECVLALLTRIGSFLSRGRLLESNDIRNLGRSFLQNTMNLPFPPYI